MLDAEVEYVEILAQRKHQNCGNWYCNNASYALLQTLELSATITNVLTSKVDSISIPPASLQRTHSAVPKEQKAQAEMFRSCLTSGDERLAETKARLYLRSTAREHCFRRA